jgi:stearoyl-CoA desaturase (Delta-9 desaturase)
MVIIYFFIAHYFLSIFCQTFFLHRYGAHHMFTMNKFWERFFHLLTYIGQGSSYLNPRGYAILHRLHHAYSDTPKDPHTPTLYGNVATMMWDTKKRYQEICRRSVAIDGAFTKDHYPEWPLLDAIGFNRFSSVAWVAFYVTFYAVFATAWWQWLLLPAQILMGPIHGAIVNWCGHKYGYRNFKVSDQSRNTLPFDFVTFGELFQNNHHRFGTDPNFAKRWFEIDPTYLIIRVLAFLHIVKLPPKKQNGVEPIAMPVAPFAGVKEA